MRITLAVVLMIATSQVKFFIGTIPFTFQTLVFFLLALILSKKELNIALITWSLLGFTNLIPSAMNSFFLSSLTLGYIFGLILGSVFISYAKKYLSLNSLWFLFLIIVFGAGVFYLPMNLNQALKIGFYPFLIGEIIKYLFLKYLLLKVDFQ